MLLYKGPSRIDGKQIVCIATIGSKNAKTGDMIQTWIMRDGIEPNTATKTGADYSVCGDCRQRHFNGGGCYVIVFNAPLTIYHAYKRGNYRSLNNILAVREAITTTPLRMGAYGDPAAVPAEVWRKLLAQGPGKWTGYTHQWRKRENDPYRDFLMASCDSFVEAEEARERGWRYFLATVKPPEDGEIARTVECLADARDMQCADCGICDGNRFDGGTQRASVWIAPHGFKERKFKEAV